MTIINAAYAKTLAQNAGIEKSELLRTIMKAIREEAVQGLFQLELNFQPDAVQNMQAVSNFLSSQDYKLTQTENKIIVDWS